VEGWEEEGKEMREREDRRFATFFGDKNEKKKTMSVTYEIGDDNFFKVVGQLLDEVDVVLVVPLVAVQL
jgi:hypothetical protein